MNKLLPRLIRFANTLAPWFLFVSIVALCWFLVAAIWLVVSPPKAHQLELLNLQPRQSTANVSGGVFSVFEAPKPIQPVVKSVNSNFKLEGVFVSSPQDLSAAVISGNGHIKRYRIGDMIEQSNYKLVEVLWNQALLEDSSGSQVELFLNDDFDLNSGAKDTPSKNSHSGYTPSHSSSSAPVMSSSSFADKPKLSPKEQLNNELDKAVSELQSNPAGYLSKMGVMATGDGYEITSGMSSQVRNNIGLKPGDKVISVNGQSVGQPQQDAQLLAEIQQSGSAEIQVQRGSQVITVRQQF